MSKYIKQKAEKMRNRWLTMQDKLINGSRPHPIVVEEAESHVCKNCGTNYRGYFCPGCGQSCNTERLSGRNTVKHVAGAVVTNERGFLYSCIDLVLRPGHMMRDYIEGRRVQYTSPVKMLLLMSTVYVLLRLIIFHGVELQDAPIHFDSDVIMDGPGDIDGKALIAFINKGFSAFHANRALSSFAMCVAWAIPFWWIFRSVKLKGERVNFWEFFYISCYVSAQHMMWMILCMPWYRFYGQDNWTTTVIPLLLTMVDMQQFFMQPWRRVAPRCIASYLLAVIVSLVFVVLAVFMAAVAWITWQEIGGN